MSRPFFPRKPAFTSSFVRINGKIRAREVRVVGNDGHQAGIMSLPDALNLARTQGVDLVEVAPNATPPVCRLVDYGKYRYEMAKKEKDAKKHQHANKVKEVQLSPSIDPHDFGVKLTRAIDFLCDDMKVKVSLRFRGRENAHKEFGFQVVQKFIQETTLFGHPDAPPREIGRGITLMLSPHPRNKRAKNPNEKWVEGASSHDDDEHPEPKEPAQPARTVKVAAVKAAEPPQRAPANSTERPSNSGGFGNNPFTQLDIPAER
ncbi:MAG: translation initiation factor IF-3 [Pedosphaera parvula]|nr:translation initiation factor IF-3 [Pedosphaera parvula]